MAWLLIRAFSDEKATAWKLGDVVEVRSEKFVDEHGWGKRECLPRFYRVQVRDVEADAIKARLEAPDETVTVDERTGEERRTLNRVRQCRVDVSRLDREALTTMDRDVAVVLSKADAETALRTNANTAVSLTATVRDDG